MSEDEQLFEDDYDVGHRTRLRPPRDEAESSEEWARGRAQGSTSPPVPTRVSLKLINGKKEHVNVDELPDDELDYYIDEYERGLKGLDLFSRGTNYYESMQRSMQMILSCLQIEKEKRSEQV